MTLTTDHPGCSSERRSPQSTPLPCSPNPNQARPGPLPGDTRDGSFAYIVQVPTYAAQAWSPRPLALSFARPELILSQSHRLNCICGASSAADCRLATGRSLLFAAARQSPFFRLFYPYVLDTGSA